MATTYQRWCVQHVLGAAKPDFKALKLAGYGAVTFMPQDSRAGQFISEAKFHGLIAGIWTVDPGSSDSGMRGDPEGYADDVISAVHSLDNRTGYQGIPCDPQLLQLNIEFAGKGYPNWRANTDVKAWHRCTESGWEWQTFQDGKSGSTKPSFAGPAGSPIVQGGTVVDGTVVWHALGRAQFDGWNWNERMVKHLRRRVSDGGVPTRPAVVQPMGRQADFNYGAYLKSRSNAGGIQLTEPIRVSPQCYDGSMVPIDPRVCVDEIVANGYVASHYPEVGGVRRAFIHPSLAPAHSDWYVPRLYGGRGYTLFRSDYMDANDLTAYRSFMLP